MRLIKIFVAGSIEGLDEERNKILQVVSAVNAQNAQLEKQVFILPISFKDFVIQSSQDFINLVIENEADIVIFLLDGSKGGDCIGEFTMKEFEIAKKASNERHLIYKIFLKKCGDIEKDNEANDTVKKIVSSKKDNKAEASNEQHLIYKIFFKKSGDTEKDNEAEDTSKDYFWHDPMYIDVVVRGAIEEALKYPRPNVPIATWRNDNFAYLTIEARFKEIFKNIFESKEPKYYTYEQFLNEIYTESEDKEDNSLAIIARMEIEKIIEKHMSYGIPNSELVRTIPFLDAEFYFYFYVLLKFIEKEKFQNSKDYDPYNKKKEKFYNDENTKSNLRDVLSTLTNNFKDAISNKCSRWLLHSCVNANSSDLSQLNVNNKLKQVKLAINESEKFDDYINTIQEDGGVVHYIVDNSGIELISDILLGLFLLHKTGITEINYHVKKLPIFVGDTTINNGYGIDDVEPAINFINEEKILGEQKITKTDTHTYTYKVDETNTKKLNFTAEDAWHQPIEFKNSTEFENWKSDDNVKLIVLKGDMNYRRLVGDRIYDLGDEIKKKIEYINNKPILILRSFKSNVILDVKAEKQKRWKPNWRTCGEFGMIQFVNNKDDSNTSNTPKM